MCQTVSSHNTLTLVSSERLKTLQGGEGCVWTSLREKGSGNDGDVERVRDRKNFIGSQGDEMDDGEMGRIRSSATTWGRKGRPSLLWWDQQAGCARAAAEAGAGAASLSTLRGPGGQDNRYSWLAGNGRSVGAWVQSGRCRRRRRRDLQVTWPGQAYPVQWQWDFALIESCG